MIFKQTLQKKDYSNFFLYLWAVLWLVSCHYFQANEGGSGLYLPSNNTTWIALSLFIASCFSVIILRQTFIYTSLTFFFFILFLLSLIPYLYPYIFNTDINTDLFPSRISAHIGLFAGLIFFFSIQQIKKNHYIIKQLISIVIAGVTIEALIILIQFFLFTNSNNWMNYDPIHAPYGIFQQSNVAASFLTTGIILSLYLIKIKTDKDPKSIFILPDWLLLTSSCLSSWALMLTGSRSGYIELGAILFLGFIGSLKSRLKTTLFWIFSVFMGVALSFLEPKQAALATKTIEQISPDNIRLAIYNRCIEMFIQKPILGWGYGNFEWTFLNHQAASYAKDHTTLIPRGIFEHPHNELLYWGVEGGILPLIALTAFVGYFLCQIRKSQQKIITTALFVPLSIHTMLELPFYHSAISWILFLFLMWIADNTASKQIRLKRTFALKILTPTLSLLTIVFMLSNLYTISLIQNYKRTSDASYFAQVINPIALSELLDSYNFAINSNSLTLTNWSTFLDQYLQEIDKFRYKQPRPIIYKSYANVLLKSNQSRRAEEIIRENNYLFPAIPLKIENNTVIGKVTF